MKTLKKTLCLVLAMVMLFGLCAVSASAKLDAYEDKDTITYKEAVDVMSGIGILAGDARGFRPTDTITRAEAAKIIAYIMVGDSTRADALKTTSDPFADVPASHWASGYIAYCATAGIIGGMGDGYHPNDNVTGLQFAKMLLAALGYGVNNEYVGTDWAINVSRDALRLKIFEKNIAGANNSPATREECALYAFNAITKVEKVSYSALLGGYITKTNTSTDSPDANMGEKFQTDFDLREEKDVEDAFGRDTGYYWWVNRKNDPITANYREDKNLKNVYTTKVTGDDIYQLLGASAIKNANIELYVNSSAPVWSQERDGDGNLKTPDTAGGDAPAAANSSEIAISAGAAVKKGPTSLAKGEDKVLAGTGDGTQTYVYQWFDKDGDSYIKICIIDTFLAKVTDVVEATAKKDPVTTVELVDATGIETAKGVDIADPNGKDTFNTDKFEEDDYVLVTVSDNKVQSVAAVPTVQAEITRYNKNAQNISIVAGGNTYTATANNVGNDELTAAIAVDRTFVDEGEYVLYLDEYGYLFAVEGVKADNDYVYVAQFGLKADTSNKLNDKPVLMAEVYYADGTSDTVVVDTTDSVISMPVDSTDVDKNNSWNTPVEDNQGGKLGVYKIEMKKGKAVLTYGPDESTPKDNAVEAAGTTSSDHNLFVNKGHASIDSGKANSKTVFFYVKGVWGTTSGANKFSVTPYIGINSVPVAEKKADARDNETKAFSKIQASDDSIKAMAVKSNIEGISGKTVYFYLGSYVDGEGHYERLKDNHSVLFYLYNGDTIEEITCEYDNNTDANDAVAATWAPGFVRLDADNHIEYVTDNSGANKGYGVVDKIKYLDDVTINYMNEITMYGLATRDTATDDESGYVNNDQFALDGAVVIDCREDKQDKNLSSVDRLNKAFNKLTDPDDSDSAVKEPCIVAIRYSGNNNQIAYMYILANNATEISNATNWDTNRRVPPVGGP